MIIIQDVLISDDVVEQEFICNLSACKGACCWEGDYGAPVTKEEERVISEILEKIRPNLSLESNQLLNKKGAFDLFSEKQFTGTTLHKDGSCVFMTFDEKGIAKCGIEKTYEEGKIDFKKPLSCHLYPIRIQTNEPLKFEAWNYDLWDICSAACTLGKKESVPVYQFLKEAIVRYKGEEFFEELDQAVKHLND
ncbi:MAG: DUF3109 family protein [Saprospiraceae bacterium]|nr:DUF3109 family protein [Saprospiraceae bacterium]